MKAAAALGPSHTTHPTHPTTPHTSARLPAPTDTADPARRLTRAPSRAARRKIRYTAAAAQWHIERRARKDAAMTPQEPEAEPEDEASEPEEEEPDSS